jgi:hypothetical protein
MVRVLQAMAGATHGGAEAFFTRLVVALAHAGLEQRAAVLSTFVPALACAARSNAFAPT